MSACPSSIRTLPPPLPSPNPLGLALQCNTNHLPSPSPPPSHPPPASTRALQAPNRTDPRADTHSPHGCHRQDPTAHAVARCDSGTAGKLIVTALLPWEGCRARGEGGGGVREVGGGGLCVSPGG